LRNPKLAARRRGKVMKGGVAEMAASRRSRVYYENIEKVAER
jgi:hypothetical protein